MNKFKIEIIESHEFTPENINDLMVTALEGGINYWCDKVNILDSFEVDISNVMFASDVISTGGKLELISDGERYILILSNFIKGIKMYCQMNNVQLSQLMDEHDANSVDQIIQYALFDKIIYG